MALTERMTQGTFVALGGDLKNAAYRYGLDVSDDAATKLPLLSAAIFNTWSDDGRIMQSDAIAHGDMVADVIEQLAAVRDELETVPEHKHADVQPHRHG